MNETALTDWLMKIVSVTGLDQDGPLNAYTPAAPATVEKDPSKIIGFDALVLDLRGKLYALSRIVTK